MSATLLAEQTALLEVLASAAPLASFTPESIANYSINTGASGLKSLQNTNQALRGLRAYRANAQALAVSALQASHPVVQQLLGEENFAHLAQDFWQALPPERGDLAQWGGELPAYLPQVPQLQALLAEYPFLPDVARVEWALHVAATATDAVLDAASFELLTSHQPTALRLLLSPGCALLRSAHPVVAIMQLHDARASALHPQAREAVASSEPQTALIWRQGLRPMIGCVDVAPAALIEATLQGQALAQALDAALAPTPDFDFSAWLAQSVQTGLLMGAVVIEQRG